MEQHESRKYGDNYEGREDHGENEGHEMVDVTFFVGVICKIGHGLNNAGQSVTKY